MRQEEGPDCHDGADSAKLEKIQAEAEAFFANGMRLRAMAKREHDERKRAQINDLSKDEFTESTRLFKIVQSLKAKRNK